MTKEKSINKLLNIDSKSRMMILLIIPPIYALWLYALGMKFLLKHHKSDKIFSLFSLLTVVLFLYIYIIIPIMHIFGIEVITTGTRVLPLLLTTFFFFFGTIGMLTSITVKNDRLKNPDHYYSLIDYKDYVSRFLAFFYWPFTIWNLQRKFAEE